jgi:hypothetical protein
VAGAVTEPRAERPVTARGGGNRQRRAAGIGDGCGGGPGCARPESAAVRLRWQRRAARSARRAAGIGAGRGGRTARCRHRHGAGRRGAGIGASAAAVPAAVTAPGGPGLLFWRQSASPHSTPKRCHAYHATQRHSASSRLQRRSDLRFSCQTTHTPAGPCPCLHSGTESSSPPGSHAPIPRLSECDNRPRNSTTMAKTAIRLRNGFRLSRSLSFRGGWVWNIWGRDCVVVHWRNGGVFQIGTDDAENLARFLAGKISQRQEGVS